MHVNGTNHVGASGKDCATVKKAESHQQPISVTPRVAISRTSPHAIKYQQCLFHRWDKRAMYGQICELSTFSAATQNNEKGIQTTYQPTNERHNQKYVCHDLCNLDFYSLIEFSNMLCVLENFIEGDYDKYESEHIFNTLISVVVINFNKWKQDFQLSKNKFEMYHKNDFAFMWLRSSTFFGNIKDIVDTIEERINSFEGNPIPVNKIEMSKIQKFVCEMKEHLENSTVLLERLSLRLNEQVKGDNSEENKTIIATLTNDFRNYLGNLEKLFEDWVVILECLQSYSHNVKNKPNKDDGEGQQFPQWLEELISYKNELKQHIEDISSFFHTHDILEKLVEFSKRVKKLKKYSDDGTHRNRLRFNVILFTLVTDFEEWKPSFELLKNWFKAHYGTDFTKDNLTKSESPFIMKLYNKFKQSKFDSIQHIECKLIERIDSLKSKELSLLVNEAEMKGFMHNVKIWLENFIYSLERASFRSSEYRAPTDPSDASREKEAKFAKLQDAFKNHLTILKEFFEDWAIVLEYLQKTYEKEQQHPEWLAGLISYKNELKQRINENIRHC